MRITTLHSRIDRCVTTLSGGFHPLEGALGDPAR